MPGPPCNSNTSGPRPVTQPASPLVVVKVRFTAGILGGHAPDVAKPEVRSADPLTSRHVGALTERDGPHAVDRRTPVHALIAHVKTVLQGSLTLLASCLRLSRSRRALAASEATGRLRHCLAQGMCGSRQVCPVALSTSAALSTRAVSGRTSAIAFTTMASLAPWARVATETCGTHWPAA